MASRNGTKAPEGRLDRDGWPLAGLAETLFDCLPDVVFFLKDTAGRYTAVNQTLVRRCGLRAKSDLLGRTAREVFPPPLGAAYHAQDRFVLSGREIRDRMELHLYDDGTRGFCLTTKLPLFGPERRVSGMVGLSRDLHRPDESRAGYQALARAVDHLQAHYDRALRIDQLASLARLPVGRFKRLVHRVFHLTPRQLLVKTRIAAAARLLLESKTSLAELALACGYTDQSAFSRQFKATVGMTPRQFREAQSGRAGGRPAPAESSSSLVPQSPSSRIDKRV